MYKQVSTVLYFALKENFKLLQQTLEQRCNEGWRKRVYITPAPACSESVLRFGQPDVVTASGGQGYDTQKFSRAAA